jgi:class 3 adenylate cyclase
MTGAEGEKSGVQIPLRTALVLGSGGLMLLAVATVLFLGYRGARDTTIELLSDSAETIINGIVLVLERELDPVVDQAIWISRHFASGDIGFGDPERLDMFVQGALAATPELTGLSLFTPGLRQRRYSRESDGVEVVDRSSDAQLGLWIDAVREQRGASWGPPVWVDSQGETVINLRTALFGGGRFLGALVQGVSIGRLSRTLAIERGEDGFVSFVLYDRDWVLAHPLLSDTRTAFSDQQPLPPLAAFSDGVVGQIWASEQSALSYVRPDSAVKARTIEVDGHDYVFLYREFRRYADKPLIVGVYFSGDVVTETDQVARLRRIAFAGGAILVLSLIAAVMAGRAIGRPILRLSDAAKKIQRGDLGLFEPLPRTAFREITDASLSFNGMVEGLRERNLVRGLLGKYVPEDVAKNLIKDRGVIEPISAEATIMFTDIAGFTTLSEAITPEAMVDMLNEYFTVMAGILEDHGGVIAQFQGDGLLAMFNVPVADPDHAAEAVRSALEIQRAVGARPFAGHALTCRIGLATGEVVAGSVGASDRLTFTVYGDTVNLASRLEQMNKEHGTQIMVHERTAELAGAFPFRSMGVVTVRGRVEPVTVYTVDG